MHPEIGPVGVPHKQLRDEIIDSMRSVIREGKLPHQLLDHHWFRGTVQHVGPYELTVSRATEHFPLDGMSFRDGMPSSLAKKDYDVTRVSELFQRWKDKQREKNQARIAAGKKAGDIEWMTIDTAGLPQQIDGITCYLLDSWLEGGIDHKKRFEAVLKPLGYSKAKVGKYSFQKRLTDKESITCSFDLGSSKAVPFLDGSFEYQWAEERVGFPVLYWGAFQEIDWQGVEKMCPMLVSTERIFTMAVENIGAILAIAEAEWLNRRRDAIQQKPD